MNYDLKEEILLKNYMPDKFTLKNMSAFFYAFSDDTRLRIVILLMMKPFCVGDITNILCINQSTVSHQLKILKALNIVDYDRQGKNMVYYIKNEKLESVFDATVSCL